MPGGIRRPGCVSADEVEEADGLGGRFRATSCGSGFSLSFVPTMSCKASGQHDGIQRRLPNHNAPAIDQSDTVPAEQLCE